MYTTVVSSKIGKFFTDLREDHRWDIVLALDEINIAWILTVNEDNVGSQVEVFDDCVECFERGIDIGIEIQKNPGTNVLLC